MNLRKLILTMVLLVAVGVVTAQSEGNAEDKTLSPYFMVKSDDPTVDRLPLLSTVAEVDVAGVIADVRVVQTYKNDGKKPIEAIYIFPASTRAAVYGMKMTIGDRVIVADVREREQARQDYEAARDAGQSASLLEQQRPNVFQMNVANIMPGDTIKVELSYTELLVPTDGAYEFAYPTVVGPRYSSAPSEGAPDTEKWVENPYTHQGEGPLYEFDITLNLVAGLPIQDMSCGSHKTNISFDGLSAATCRLDASERDGGNRDFILQYRLAGGKIESGLLLYEGKEENFFLTMIQPPKRVPVDQIPGREYVFIVDVSGSMYGFPLNISKKLLRDLITNLKPTDRFNVLLFAGGNKMMAEKSLAATESNIAKAVQVIDNQQGGGGTQLLPAMKRALALPRAKGISRTFVIVTDGYVTVETETFDLIRDNLGDANMFAFGIGSGVNRFLIEGMARVGMGEPFVITNETEAPGQAEKFRRYIQSPVLTGIDVSFPGLDVYDVEPKSVPDVFAERPIIVFGKYRGRAKGRVVVRGRTGSGRYERVLDVAKFTTNMENAALRYLWARHRIQLLDDYNRVRRSDDRVKEVTALGLKYNLLTQYTSFVAIDSRVRSDGKTEVVKQPLPLPQGVSDYAVGGYASSGLGGAGRTMKHGRVPMARPLMQVELECSDGDASPVLPGSKVTSGLVEVGDVTISLGITGVGTGPLKQVAASVVESHMTRIDSCYAAELAGNPGLGGEMLVKLTIGPDGSVSKVEFLKNELNTAMRECVERVFRKLTFAGTAGHQVVLYVPLEFSP